MTYLELVNEALRESGSTLDSLTAGNFANPPDPMYTKFKQWVAQAWEDIQTDRRDWQYMQESAVSFIRPGIEVYGASSALITDFVGQTFSLHNAANPSVITTGSQGLTLTSGAVLAGTGEGTLNIASFADDGVFMEPGDILISAGSTSCFFRRWARYGLENSGALRDNVTDIAEIKLDSVAIADVKYDVGQAYDDISYRKLNYVPYSSWLRYGYDRPKRIGTPTAFTLSNNGLIEFYPPIDTNYNLFFEYTKTPQTLSLHGDVPTGLPARFHKAISWKAVMYYSEYDGIARIYNIASKRFIKFEYEMIRDLLPTIGVSYDSRRF